MSDCSQLSNGHPACMGGCFINPNFICNDNIYKTPESKPFPVFENNGLTDDEKECLEHLVKAWNLFVSFKNKHSADDNEFCTAIHDAQKMVALRVARRVDSDVWKTFNGEQHARF